MSGQEGASLKAHMVAILVVGGVLLFGFVVYLFAALIHFLFTNERVLVYAFAVVFTVQAYWMLFAYLKRRFRPRDLEEY